MGKKKADSYLDTLSSGYESDTVKEYDPATSEDQMGKEHEEEVAKSNNWEDDKRNEVGKAARIARKLRRVAREIEAMGMNEEYQETIEDATEQVEDEATGADVEGEIEDLQEEEKKVCSKDEHIIIEAVHPIEHDISKDNPEANMDAQTGDEDWIEIGPGEFDDKRNEVGKAA